MATEHPRVALAVTPRMFSDTLGLLLTGAGLEVVEVPDDDPAGDGPRFAVLVTSRAPRRDAPADVVIYLPESQEIPRARTSTGQWLPLQDMSDVISFIRALLTDTSP